MKTFPVRSRPMWRFAYFALSKKDFVTRRSTAVHDEPGVRLERVDDQLHLCVSDEGSGFAYAERANKGGLGIRSMEERLRLVGGRFELHSEAGKGTWVDAWVPFRATRDVAGGESGVPKATKGEEYEEPSARKLIVRAFFLRMITASSPSRFALYWRRAIA